MPVLERAAEMFGSAARSAKAGLPRWAQRSGVDRDTSTTSWTRDLLGLSNTDMYYCAIVTEIWSL